MVERLVISLVLIIGGLIAYRFWIAWQVQRLANAPLFQNFVAGKPGIVLFTADFCQPCKTQQQPAIEKLLQQVEDVQFIEVDVQAKPELAARWGVLSLPTTFILDAQGQPRQINFGITSTETLRKQIEAIG